jgi:hypothetical protein
MEEARTVAECKIKALQTQNEALRLHLRLAVESLKNPIPAVVPPSRRTSIGEDWEEYNSDAPDEVGDGSDEDGNERDEMEARLEDLLKDLGMFRRKVSDDKSRFLGDAYLKEIHIN